MRIQEVVKRTNLQKRTIYYYIKEKLVIPSTTLENGYHDFSEDDVSRLIIIRKLRDAGLPLADIRSILSNPRTAPYYLHKQLHSLQTQLLTIEETIKNLDTFSTSLTVCHSLDQFSEELAHVEFKPDSHKYNAQYTSRDARLIARYLWQSFIEVPMTEYRQFLWQKIMQTTLEHIDTDLKVMTQYLQSLSPEQLDTANVTQYLRNQKIIALTPEDYPDYVEELKKSLLLFATDETQKKKWQLVYRPLILPTTLFAYTTSPLFLEFHPDYNKYYDNIHACCMMLKDYLDSKEGEKFKQLLTSVFQESYDFEESGYGELEIAATFHYSVYNAMSINEIEAFLLANKLNNGGIQYDSKDRNCG